MKKFIICIFLIFFYHNCYDQYSSELLQTTLDEYLKDKTNVLGTIVKVNISGTESYEAASGFIDSSKTKPINSDTKFNIASITKVFTSVLVHQYIEKGQGNLKDPIFNYLPADWSALLCNIEYGREITVEHTLSHRSGIADITEFEELREFLISDSSKRLKPLDALEWVQQKGVPKFKPGDNFDYCNINYILLGALIENVSGNSYLLTLQENILDRIGLESTFLAGETIGSSNMEIAHSYLQNDDKLYDGHNISLEWGMAAGGIISNADNLIKFYEALVSGKLFDRKETYEQMSKLVDHNESYGKGWK